VYVGGFGQSITDLRLSVNWWIVAVMLCPYGYQYGKYLQIFGLVILVLVLIGQQ